VELLELRRPRAEVNVGCCWAFWLFEDDVLMGDDCAAAAATATACDFAAAVWDFDGGLFVFCCDAGWLAFALCARKATSRFARNGLLVGMTGVGAWKRGSVGMCMG